MPPSAPHDRQKILARKRGLPDLNDLFVACSRHLLLTSVFSVAAATALAIAAWVLIPPVYQADGLIRVREKQSVIFAAQTSLSEDTAFFRTQSKLARSPQVLRAAITDTEATDYVELIPAEERVNWLKQRLTAVIQPGSEVMSITVKHGVPEVAQALCNATTRAYLAEITKRLAQDRLVREQQLEIAAKQADRELDLAWRKLHKAAIDVGSDNATTMTLRDEMQLQAFREHSRRLHAAELQGNQLRARLDDMRSTQHTRSNDENSIELRLQREPQIALARKKVAEVELQIQQMDQIAANPSSPQLARLIRERNYYADELDALIDLRRSELSQKILQETKFEKNSKVANLKQEIELNQTEIKFLRQQLNAYDPAVTNVAAKTAVPLDMSRHEIRRLSGLADSLWKALQEHRIEVHSQPRVTLISLASLPGKANRAAQYRGVAIAGLGGWLLVILCVGHLEWRDCRVRCPADVQSVSAYPLFGAVTSSSNNTYSRNGWKQRTSRLLGLGTAQPSCGVREAATRLILRDLHSTRTTTLMVTSCIASEPRHLISQEIAVLLAGYQRTVLLIDCDTDRGQLSQSLGANSSIGIRQMPRCGESPACEAVSRILIATDNQSIDFLPIGPTDEHRWWVDPRSLRGVLRVMRDRYDVIVVNGPSLMGSAESVLLAAEVDHSVFSTFVNKSRWDQLLTCEEAAQNAGVPLSGCIYHSGKSLSGLKTTGTPAKHRLANADRNSDETTPTATLRTHPTEDPQSLGNSTESELKLQITHLQHEVKRAQLKQKTHNSAKSFNNTNSQPDSAET
jgi:capsular polysaccharide biosynthesis protein